MAGYGSAYFQKSVWVGTLVMSRLENLALSLIDYMRGRFLAADGSLITGKVRKVRVMLD